MSPDSKLIYKLLYTPDSKLSTNKLLNLQHATWPAAPAPAQLLYRRPFSGTYFSYVVRGRSNEENRPRESLS